MLIDILKIPSVVELGHQSEQGKLIIYFDLKKWLKEYPEVQSGTASIKMELPNGEVLPVLVTNFDKDNAIVEWPIGLTETTIPGRGAADLTINWNDGLAKSYKFITLVYEAVGTGIEPTSYTPDWIDTLIDELQQTRNILDDNRITDENTWSAEKIAEEIATGGTGIPIPKKLSDLTNDTGFIDNAVTDLIYYYTKDETYAKSEVNTLINNIHAMSVVIVPVLPEVGQADIFYLVPREEIKVGNVYDEYLWANNKWEKIGGTPVDTNLYYTKAETDAKLAEKLTPPTVTASDVDKAIIWNGTEWAMGEAGGSGTDNYNDLNNKPKINNVTLQGNVSLAALGIPSQEQTYTKDDIDEALENKVDADDVYDKTEIDTALSNKVDAGTVFTKQQVQTLVDQKADAVAVYVKNEVYNKTEIDNKVNTLTDALNDKADASSVYSKSETYSQTEIDNKLKAKTSASESNGVVNITDGTGSSYNVYNKTQADTLLSNKTSLTLDTGTFTVADGKSVPTSATTYTKDKIDDMLRGRTTIVADAAAGTATIANNAGTPTSVTIYNKAKVDELLADTAQVDTDVSEGTITITDSDTTAVTYDKTTLDSMIGAKLDNPNPTPDDNDKYIKYSYNATTGKGRWVMGTGSGGGQTAADYTDLTSKPKLNSVEIVGNLNSKDLKVADTIVINNVEKTLTSGTSKINIGNVITGVKKDGTVVNPDSNGVVNINIIDDTSAANNTTYSSNKIAQELDGKASFAEASGVITLTDDNGSSTAYTKAKVDDIVDGFINDVKLNGTSQTVSSGSVNINAITGVKVDGTSVSPVNGVVDIPLIDNVVLSNTKTFSSNKIADELKNKATITTSATDGTATIADSKTSAASATVYTKTKVDTLLSDKANSADVYTKTETDALLDDKLDTSAFETAMEGVEESFTNIADALKGKTTHTTSNGVITLTNQLSPAVTITSYSKDKVDDLLDDKVELTVDSANGKFTVADDTNSSTTYDADKIDDLLDEKIDDPKPESTDEGKVLTWDGEDWVAEDLPTKPYSSLRRLRSYLYEVTFDELPAYSESGDAPFTGGCTSFIQNGKLHRNLDWNYSETAAFKVVTKDFVGMAFNDSVKEGSLDDFKIGQLPYHVNDGVNDYGIMVTTHVLYNDWNWNNASGHTSITKLPYLILSTVKSMAELSTKLSTVLSDLYAPDALKAMGYLVHFMVSDGTTTYVIEPPTSATGAYQLINASDCPKFVNFRWINKAQITSRNDALLQNRPNGIERWNLIPCELSDLRYTKSYETNAWLSEFIGVNETTKASTDAQLQAIYELGHTAYLNRTRNDEVPTWQTFYSVVYSNKGMEHLWAQEDWNRDYCSSSGVWESGSGNNSVVVSGSQSTATGSYATAEGFANRASGNYSHAEGVGNIISIDGTSNPDWNMGIAAHLEGSGNTAAGNYSHVEGANTLANNIVEHAEGQYNKSNMHSTTFGDSLNTLRSVGIGTNDNARKNAEEIMQNGDQYVIGIGGYDGTNPSTADSLQDVIEGKITAPASATANQVLTYDTTNGWVAKNPTGGSAPTVVGTTLVFG